MGKKGAKVISNGFLRLTNADGTVATDGTKEITTFKPPRSVDERAFYLGTSRQSPTYARLTNAGPPHIRSLCIFSPDAANSNKLAIRKGEVIKLRTTLCSTYLTQNGTPLSSLIALQSAGD